MPLTIIRDNIAAVNTDAVVLPANPELKEGSGVSHAIYEAAGRIELESACASIGCCDFGMAVITDGFKLPARHIIHAVNPPYIDGMHNEEELLYKTYCAALELARECGLSSIAFPLLSSGNYGYPKGAALAIANKAIGVFMARGELESDMDIRLVLYDRDALRNESEIYESVSDYISDCISQRVPDFTMSDEHRRNDITSLFTKRTAAKRQAPARAGHKSASGAAVEKNVSENCSVYSAFDNATPPATTDDVPCCANDIVDAQKTVFEPAFGSIPDFGQLIKNKQTFLEMLMKYMIESEMTNAEIYSRANINRKTFSKIINGQVIPKKETILALAIALRLTLEQTEDLLARAGHAFIEADLSDTIIKYFIANGRYDIFLINEYLYDNDQKLLGNVVA